MFSYPTYKLMHLAFIFLFLASVAISLLGDNKSKLNKAIVGICSFGIIFGGMGLFKHIGGVWQPWLIVKMVIWGLVVILAPILAKRLKNHRTTAVYILVVLIATAASMAVYKPF